MIKVDWRKEKQQYGRKYPNHQRIAVCTKLQYMDKTPESEEKSLRRADNRRKPANTSKKSRKNFEFGQKLYSRIN
jgi:hypothetical protein